MSRLANGIVVGLLVFILMAGAYLKGGDASPDPELPSVFSAEGRGRNVSFELLSHLGFNAQAWTGAPGDLPQSPSLLLATHAPVAPEHYEAAESKASGPSFDGSYAPSHYRGFVEQGGTLVLNAGSDKWGFLERQFDVMLEPASTVEVAFDDLESIVPAESEEAAMGGSFGTDVDSRRDYFRRSESFEAELRGAGSGLEPLTLNWEFEGLPVEPRDFEPLLTTPEGDWVMASLSVGKGHLVLSESDFFFDNDFIERDQNALLVVRLAERFALDRNVYFDEYSLGGWTPESPLDMAFSLPARPLSVHLVLLMLLVFWSAGWVRWFPRDPAPLGAISAGMRARGLAGLLQGRRRWELLAQMLRQGVLRRLGRRTGLGQGQLEGQADALQDPAWIRDLMWPLLHTQSDAQKEQSLKLLGPGNVASRKQLDQLARDLAALESSLLAASETTE